MNPTKRPEPSRLLPLLGKGSPTVGTVERSTDQVGASALKIQASGSRDEPKSAEGAGRRFVQQRQRPSRSGEVADRPGETFNRPGPTESDRVKARGGSEASWPVRGWPRRSTRPSESAGVRDPSPPSSPSPSPSESVSSGADRSSLPDSPSELVDSAPEESTESSAANAINVDRPGTTPVGANQPSPLASGANQSPRIARATRVESSTRTGRVRRRGIKLSDPYWRREIGILYPTQVKSARQVVFTLLSIRFRNTK